MLNGFSVCWHQSVIACCRTYLQLIRSWWQGNATNARYDAVSVCCPLYPCMHLADVLLWKSAAWQGTTEKYRTRILTREGTVPSLSCSDRELYRAAANAWHAQIKSNLILSWLFSSCYSDFVLVQSTVEFEVVSRSYSKVPYNSKHKYKLQTRGFLLWK